MRRYSTVVMLFLMLLAGSVQAAEPLRFGVLGSRPMDAAEEQWQPFAQYLQEMLHRPVRLQVYDHRGLEAAIARNNIDAVLTSPGQYVQLQAFYGLSAPLAKLVGMVDGREVDAIGGVIIARADDAGVNTLHDLARARIAYVSAESFGGYQAQMYELLEAGEALPSKALMQPLGLPQDEVVEAVLGGRADVGFVGTGLIEAMVHEGRLDRGRLKIINPQKLPGYPCASSTRLYPGWPVAMTATMSESQAHALAVALLTLPPQSRAARAAGIYGFTIPGNYSGVERLMKGLLVPPFNIAPEITAGELWRQYSAWLIALAVLFALLLAMGVKLLLQNRQVARSARLFRTLAGAAPVGVLRADAAGHCLYHNEKWSEFTGQPEAAQGQHGWLNALSVRDRERLQPLLQQLLEAGGSFSAEYSFALPGGEMRCVFGQTVAEKNGVGQVTGYLSVITDVSPLKQASLLREAMLSGQAEAGIGQLIIGQGRVLMANHAVSGITGYTNAELLNLPNFIDLVHPDDRERVLANYRHRLGGDESGHRYEISLLTRSGERREVEVATVALKYARDMQVLVIMLDISARKRNEARLKLAASVFTHAREGIMIADARGLLVDVNAAFTEITGYSRDEVVGKNPRILHSGRQSQRFYQDMWAEIVLKDYWIGELWNQRKDGSQFAEMLSVTSIRDDAGRVQNYVALFTEITELKEQQLQLERIAHYDALTGLPNRLLLADRIHQAKARCERRDCALAVVYLDLDGFKAINDTYGHEVGDELLVEVSRRMREALRDGDTLARIGGDEFVAVLAELEVPNACEPVLMRLLHAAAEPVRFAQYELQVSASIGVTLYPKDGVDADMLIRHADQAMYLAKQAGKNRYHMFDVEKDEALKTQRENVERIQLAIEQDEFVLYYQPKVNMRTGAVVGAEALIRWQHPERGLLVPTAFLPFVENHPVDTRLGEWVIDSVLAQMRQWRDVGLSLPVSVNIGASHLQREDFAQRLRELLSGYPDYVAGSLELEVLESSALQDIAKVSQLMGECHELGVSFALDDFGTGYSSLTYLKRLPAEVLKVDQSFVRDLVDQPDDLAIVEGVLGLATAFQREAVAEGVESVVHGEMLLPLGCELAQGYGIARPMSAAAMPGWVANWRTYPEWAAWDGRVFRRDDANLVYAEVEHRHWVNQIEAAIHGGLELSLEQLERPVYFMRWTELCRHSRFGRTACLHEAVAVHEQILALGRTLVLPSGDRRRNETAPGLIQLHTLRDQLINKLRELYDHDAVRQEGQDTH